MYFTFILYNLIYSNNYHKPYGAEPNPTDHVYIIFKQLIDILLSYHILNNNI